MGYSFPRLFGRVGDAAIPVVTRETRKPVEHSGTGRCFFTFLMARASLERLSKLPI